MTVADRHILSCRREGESGIAGSDGVGTIGQTAEGVVARSIGRRRPIAGSAEGDCRAWTSQAAYVAANAIGLSNRISYVDPVVVRHIGRGWECTRRRILIYAVWTVDSIAQGVQWRIVQATGSE